MRETKQCRSWWRRNPAADAMNGLIFVTGQADVLIRHNDSYRRVSTAEIKRDLVVQVWFTGPVAESDPVQARAETVVIESYP